MAKYPSVNWQFWCWWSCISRKKNFCVNKILFSCVLLFLDYLASAVEIRSVNSPCLEMECNIAGLRPAQIHLVRDYTAYIVYMIYDIHIWHIIIIINAKSLAYDLLRYTECVITQSSLHHRWNCTESHLRSISYRPRGCPKKIVNNFSGVYIHPMIFLPAQDTSHHK